MSKIDWNGKQKYIFNVDEMFHIACIINNCIAQSQRLYYKHSDTEIVQDPRYDAIVKFVRKLAEKYPEFKGVLLDYDGRVGY